MSEHRCRRAERCARSEKHGDQTLGAILHTPDGLCLTCTSHVLDAITDLPRDYLELTLALPAGGSINGQKIRSSKTPPVPIRLSIDALRDQIVHDTTLWAEAVAEKMNSTLRPGRPTVRLAAAVRILTGNITALLVHPTIDRNEWNPDGETWDQTEQDGLDGALSLLALHQRTRAALGRTTLVHHLGVPCPSVECGAMALVRHNGADDVICEACRRRWPHDQWRRLTLVAADRPRTAA